MDFAFKLFALLISISFVQSKAPIKVSKSIKLNEKMIYDCVDIYKQPSLNHPLLKNHKIQMEPSLSIPNSKSQVETKRYEKIIDCPNGTVPILRNTKEYVANAQYFSEKHFNPLIVESHGTHFAGVRLQGQSQDSYHGIASMISVHDLNISGEQASYAHIWVGSRVNNKDNFIQTGWMINPSLYGDSGTWTYGFWKGTEGACYNTQCSGFVQMSKTTPLVGSLPPTPSKERNIGLTFQQDKESGNWWVSFIMNDKPDLAIGYWPKELFDLIGNGVNMVGTGGVESSPSGVSPPMGNGHLPTKKDMESARVKEMFFMDSSLEFKLADTSKLGKLLDSEKCYGIKKGKQNLFTFGGPGGDSCGI